MSRTNSVHFSPPVGCRIHLVDANGSVVTASTLSIRDKTPFKHRTPKGTPRGKEYFYVKTKNGKEWSYIKMMNSNLLPKCISEDGKYIFEGEMANGGQLGQRKTTKVKPETRAKKNVSSNVQTFTNNNFLNTP
jgi:hypothetical protein